jgi:uncharacterized protein with FMN-binding domain
MEDKAVSRFVGIVLVLLVPLALFLAWVGGQYRITETTIEQLQNIAHEITDVTLVGDNLYRGKSRNNPEKTFYIAHVSKPSYGGPMEVAAVVDSDKKIRYTAVLSSPDTRSYLEKVIGLGILDAFIDTSIEQMPAVDAVSGATISSTALIRGVESAAQQIGSSEFGMPKSEEKQEAATPETLKLIIICLFFAAAFVITTKRVRKKNRARTALLCCSVTVLGFWFGTQFSLATVAILINGSWLKGMATYATLLCLVLTIFTFLITRKNLFCTSICPFGAIQEGIGKITGCSTPVQSTWMVWVARGWVLTALLAALYLQAPSYAMYGPLGMTFNFIGSGIIYSLTILVVLSSLMFKQPWCRLFCPTSIMISYLRFARKVFIPNSGLKKAKVSQEIQS